MQFQQDTGSIALKKQILQNLQNRLQNIFNKSLRFNANSPVTTGVDLLLLLFYITLTNKHLNESINE